LPLSLPLLLSLPCPLSLKGSSCQRRTPRISNLPRRSNLFHQPFVYALALPLNLPNANLTSSCKNVVRAFRLKAAILTISDKGSRGERVDQSGPALSQFLIARNVEIAATAIVADEIPLIAQALQQWADSDAADLILSTGGTGLSPRDVTPEATMQILDRTVPGFSEAMRTASLAKTPYAMMSRAVCGIRNRALIVNLPGSPIAAVENLEAIWPAIPHAIKKLQGDMTDCAPNKS
jgi:molybdopterin adenylyltransferase